MIEFRNVSKTYDTGTKAVKKDVYKRQYVWQSQKNY